MWFYKFYCPLLVLYTGHTIVVPKIEVRRTIFTKRTQFFFMKYSVRQHCSWYVRVRTIVVPKYPVPVHVPDP